ncbi:hypothetical protein HFN80_35655 [Rhizobium laguerreae]|uniref:hypothetical protein n=1 Tax=Rhizobium laguerreae TaxID=1076926 RepID=UPI001C91CCD5|nr:hypothetical protein [Rhizobium laguerreae]MBY3469238.1 hypothetical protein [Rhizobium laguerreae]
MSDDTAAKFAAQQTVNVMTAMIIKGLVQVGGVTPATAAAAALFASTRAATDAIVSADDGTGAVIGGIASGLATGIAAYLGLGLVPTLLIGVAADQAVRAGFDAYEGMKNGLSFQDAVEQALHNRAEFLGELFGDGLDGAGHLMDFFGDLLSPLANVIRDPLVLDLDGDGVELTALAGSNVHFDFAHDGFAEKTGWVAPDDGILVRDSNSNGQVDDAGELFGSATQDGFAVLETIDENGDGKIDAQDQYFSQLKAWRDLNQNGQTDAGELQTLTEAGITSISVERIKVDGTNSGHTIGYRAEYERTDGSADVAETVYFQTDPQSAASDTTPEFEIDDAARFLPKFSGSGQIHSIAWKATTDQQFRADWANLTDNATSLSFDELRESFGSLLLRWAGVDGVDVDSRGHFVDARHLTFVEQFFGTTYTEASAGNVTTSSPTRAVFGSAVEGSFDAIVDGLLSVFLSQADMSRILRGVQTNTDEYNPYGAFALMVLIPTADPVDRREIVKEVLQLTLGSAPASLGDAASYYVKSFAALEGGIASAFPNDRAGFLAVATPLLATVENADLAHLLTRLVAGNAALGTTDSNVLTGLAGVDVFVGVMETTSLFQTREAIYSSMGPETARTTFATCRSRWMRTTVSF